MWCENVPFSIHCSYCTDYEAPEGASTTGTNLSDTHPWRLLCWLGTFCRPILNSEKERQRIDSVAERHKHCCRYWIWEQFITRKEARQMRRNATKKTQICCVAYLVPTAKENVLLCVKNQCQFFFFAATPYMETGAGAARWVYSRWFREKRQRIMTAPPAQGRFRHLHW